MFSCSQSVFSKNTEIDSLTGWEEWGGESLRWRKVVTWRAVRLELLLWSASWETSWCTITGFVN